jgi:hypothetical protein
MIVDMVPSVSWQRYVAIGDSSTALRAGAEGSGVIMVDVMAFTGGHDPRLRSDDRARGDRARGDRARGDRAGHGRGAQAPERPS